MPYYHIIMNPDNVRWDGYWDESDDLTWDAACESATFKGKDYWSLELAIPWASLGRSVPAAGTQLLGNICRQRKPRREYSSWSQCVSGFVEPGAFGTWVFR